MPIDFERQAAVTAVQFLTRIPLPGGMNVPEPDRRLLSASVGYFPWVGGAIGLTTGLVAWGASQVLPAAVAVGLALAFEAWLTNAFHEDAVADCCDAFGGGWTRDDVLRIMKDSRVGSFGTLGLLLAVGLRWSCLQSLAQSAGGAMVPTCLAAGAVGRWAILRMMATIAPIPSRDGLSRDVGSQPTTARLWLGSAGMLAWGGPWIWLNPLRALLTVGLVLLCVAAWSRYVQRRLGGVTGDCLGCQCYLAQLLVLMVACAQRAGAE
jgi:adenosylcobinamide-GDP ribazoletransferase